MISTAVVSGLEVSIDQHPMYIYAVDGRYIVPQLVHAVTVPNGNRYAAMIKLDQPVGDYAIRVAAVGLNQIASGLAVLSYVGGGSSSSAPFNTTSTSTSTPTSIPYINYAGQLLSSSLTAFSDAAIVPFTPLSPAPTSDVTYILSISNLGGAYLWTLSGTAIYPMPLEDAIPPVLFQPPPPPSSNLTLTLTSLSGQWIDLIIQVVGPVAPPHPIHKHGNKGFLIGSGTGLFTARWTSVADALVDVPESFNLVNPPLRDGYTTIPAVGEPTWLVVRYQSVNPGAWLLHCHIQTHLSGGMAVVVLDGVDRWPVLEAAYADVGEV